MTDVTHYYVYAEHTLCYHREGWLMYGVLARSVLRGGHDPLNGSISPSPLCTMRPATLADFEFFRVVPPPGYIDPERLPVLS